MPTDNLDYAREMFKNKKRKKAEKVMGESKLRSSSGERVTKRLAVALSEARRV